MKADHWIRGIRSHVSGDVVSHNGKQVEMPIFGRGRSQMKLITGFATFDPASGDVVSQRDNQVEMSIFGRGAHK